MLLVVKKPLTIRKVGGENGKSNDVWPPSANHCLFWKDVLSSPFQSLLSLLFAPKQLKWIHNGFCFLVWDWYA